MMRLEGVGVDLLADLERIAPIHKDGRSVDKYHSDPGLTGKPCQPSQSLLVGRNPFALVFVLQGYQESGEIAPLKLRAEGR